MRSASEIGDGGREATKSRVGRQRMLLSSPTLFFVRASINSSRTVY